MRLPEPASFVNANPQFEPARKVRKQRLKSVLATVFEALHWWRAPFWALAVFTGAKSFADNPIIGSVRLNRAGLHAWRIRTAHALAWRRRRRLAKALPDGLREQFERDGFVVVPDVLVPAEFDSLRAALFETAFESRSQQQGDTITRRIAVGPEVRSKIPALSALLESGLWRSLMAYVATRGSAPLYYIQTIFGGVASGPSDPQLELHSDTFHPSLKAWLFLTDVGEKGRPLTYVAGSHRLTEGRLEWEKRKSINVMSGGDRLSQRGSFRIRPDELQALGLPPPTRFCVPANTLVVADTCGFHARASSDEPSGRVEIWAYCRRNPFLPWTAPGPLSWPPVARRQAEWLYSLVDGLDRLGLKKQHWVRSGRCRAIDPE